MTIFFPSFIHCHFISTLFFPNFLPNFFEAIIIFLAVYSSFTYIVNNNIYIYREKIDPLSSNDNTEPVCNPRTVQFQGLQTEETCLRLLCVERVCSSSVPSRGGSFRMENLLWWKTGNSHGWLVTRKSRLHQRLKSLQSRSRSTLIHV